MQKPTNWTGNYSRFSFDETRNYVYMLKEQGLEVLDDEFNVLQEMLRTSLRRLTQDTIGNGAIGAGFQIVGTGGVNDFTITGGGGAVDSAAHLYLHGWMALLLYDTTYATQPVTQPALTTPSAARVDEVYLDIWLDEIDGIEDSNIKDPTLNKETSRRAQLKWAVKVAEGALTPAPYADANGAQHYTYKLATLNRTTASTIDADMVVDARNVIQSLVDHVNDPSDAHDASAISYPGATKAPGPDAKSALNALAAEIASAITGLGGTADNTAVNQLLNAILSACVQVSGDTMTGPLTVPELRVVDANGLLRRIGGYLGLESIAGGLLPSALLDIQPAVNASWDGTNWNRLDTARPAARWHYHADGRLELYVAPAGANPIIWSGPYRIFNETTPVYHRSGSFAVGDGATVNMDISLPVGVWLVTAKGLATQVALGVIATVVGVDSNVIPPVNQLSAEDYNAGSLSVTTYQAAGANTYLTGVQAGFRIVAVSSAGYPYTCYWYATRLM